ncbi:hypothetical protein PENTCL1PPCAC_15224, partial [Pristionchus entomophagus]
QSSRRELEIALNPIGSLAFRERLEKKPDKLIATFNILGSSAVTLTLSLNGYRIVECFLNANIDDVNVRLADSLSEDWEGLKKVLKTAKGRYVCETLLNRGLKEFAHKFITIVPKDWWFKNEEGLQSLHILIKAIEISDVEVANSFCSYEQMEESLCDSAEGLYCVLKVKRKSMNQPGWKELLRELILRKATTAKGSEALVQAIVYGDFLVMGIVAMICGRRESFDDSSTVSLIIRWIELGGSDLKQFIFEFLCAPNSNPLICRIRFTIQFDDFKQACDSHFSPAQRSRLDECLAEDRMIDTIRIESKVDECLKMLTSQDAPVEAMDTTTTEGNSKKRKSDLPIESPNPEVKKPREEVSEASPMTDSHEETPNEATVTSLPEEPSASSNMPTPGSESTPRPISADPGVDVVSMVMGGKAREILRELKFGTADYRSSIFECIQNGLLALMMDERGCEVVKWFIVNGCFKQNGTIERRVMENVEGLVRSGDYGIAIVKTAIAECTKHAKKKELSEKYERAMRCPPYSTLPSLDEGLNDEIKIVSENIDRETTVAEVSEESGGSASMRLPTENQPEEPSTRAIPSVSQESFADPDSFNKILEKLKTDTANIDELKSFADYAAGWKKMKDDIKGVVVDQVIESVSMSETESGMLFTRMLACKQSLRPLLVYPIASILHKLCGSQGKQVLTMMLSNQTCTAFIHSCFAGEESSFFVKMFHSDTDKYECASIGMNILARANDRDRTRIRAFLSRYGRSIAETEKGRIFIVMVADPNPMGWNWKELLDLLPSPSANPSSTANEAEETVASGPKPPESTDPPHAPASAVEKLLVKEVSPSAEDDVDGGETMQESSTEEQTPLPLPEWANLKNPNEGIPSLFSFTTAPPPLLHVSNLKNAKERIPSLFSFAVQDRTTPVRSVSRGWSDNRAPNDNPLLYFRSDANTNPFQPIRKVDHTLDSSLSQSPRFQVSSPYFRPLPTPTPLFKCPGIGVSQSGVPSFPTMHRPPPNPLLFPFKQPPQSSPSQFELKKSSLPLSFSSLVTEQIVKDTVEFIVNSVVEANP